MRAALAARPGRRAHKFQAGAWTTRSAARHRRDRWLQRLQRAQIDLLGAEAVFVVTRGRDAPRCWSKPPGGSAGSIRSSRGRRTSRRYPRDVRWSLAGPGAGVPEVAQAARAAPPRRRRRACPTCSSTAWPPSSPMATRPGCRSCGRRTWLSMAPACPRLSSCVGNGSPRCPRCTSGTQAVGDDLRGARGLARTGALGELPFALIMRVYVHLFAGELTAAASLVEEIRTATDASDTVAAPYGAVGLLVLRGRRRMPPISSSAAVGLTDRGEGVGLSVLDWAEADFQRPRPLRGRPGRRAARHRTSARPRRLELGHGRAHRGRCRAGTPELAADALRRLVDTTAATARTGARGRGPLERTPPRRRGTPKTSTWRPPTGWRGRG